jgi:hypothetical protein
MEDLNLDINSYTIEDLEVLFKLNSLVKYKPADIENKEKELGVMVLSVESSNTKKQMLDFIRTAKEILIKEKCEITDISETSINKTVPKLKEDTGYFTGKFNPIEKRIVSKLFSIDTMFRSNYYNTKATDYVYSLPETIHDVVSMQVIGCEIPNNWFSVSKEKKNNQLTITTNNVYDISGVVGASTYIIPHLSSRQTHTFKITVPDGSYSPEAFQNALRNIFWNTTIDSSGTHTNALNYLTVNIDPNTSQTIIRAKTQIDVSNTDISLNVIRPIPCPFEDGNAYFDQSFNFSVSFLNTSDPDRPLYKNLGWMMGFRKPYYSIDISNTYQTWINEPVGNVRYKTSDGSITYKGYLSSESSYGSFNDNYIFLEIDDYHSNYNPDLIIAMDNNSSYLGKNTMARIPIESSKQKIIIAGDGSIDIDKIFRKREYFGPVKIEKLNIRLLDRYGDVINLNQNDYSIALEIKQYR